MEIKPKVIFDILNKKFPNAKCELGFSSVYQLLVAVILSAQCTDKRVNMVTQELFKKYPTAKEMANAKQEELEQEIHSCGLYHNKAKNIISASKDIVQKFNGEVPGEFDELVGLAGVGRKTANVVTSVGFGEDAIAVDTHVFRVARRLGLANADTPERVEMQLREIIEKKYWSQMHYLLVLFGRYFCKAQKPLCEECEFKKYCKYYLNK